MARQTTPNGVRLYQTLGLPRTDASAEEIKRAYRRLSLRHHPDRNPNDPMATSRFQAVVLAYEVLGSVQKRRVYDSYGEQGLRLYEGYMAFTEGGADAEAVKFAKQPLSMLALLCCCATMLVLLLTATCVAVYARLSQKIDASLTMTLLPLWVLDACFIGCMCVVLLSMMTCELSGHQRMPVPMREPFEILRITPTLAGTWRCFDLELHGHVSLRCCCCCCCALRF
jgi:hypothetical protein